MNSDKGEFLIVIRKTLQFDLRKEAAFDKQMKLLVAALKKNHPGVFSDNADEDDEDEDEDEDEEEEYIARNFCFITFF